MKRLTLMCLNFALPLVPALAHAEVSCTRGGLQQAVDLYIAAQTQGDVSALPLAKGVGYWENAAPADMQKGLITKPMNQLCTVHRCQLGYAVEAPGEIVESWRIN